MIGRRRAVAAALACCCACALAASVSSGSGADAEAVYIVELSGEPASALVAGDVGKLGSALVSGYRDQLRAKQRRIASAAGGLKPLYDYSVALNGFAASMATSTAAELRKLPGVRSVTRDVTVHPQSLDTTRFLGMTKRPGGAWARAGGGRRAGSGVVVGIIDSGIWPENPLFAPLAHPGNLRGWHGECVVGPSGWDASTCNNKLIGARYYTGGQGGDAAIPVEYPGQYVSARDADSHGTHVAGIAVGDYKKHVQTRGGVGGVLSGMAPNARVAAYKVCWSGNCATSDAVKAIDDATADGVDVINYSLGGSRTSLTTPVETAFRNAARAGVFIAAAAGNGGPRRRSVVHLAPWETTVAASTHDASFRTTVKLGDGRKFTGAGTGGRVGPSALVAARNAGRLLANADSVRHCLPDDTDSGSILGVLDPAKAGGRVVVCDGGGTNLSEKARAVADANGVGVIVANASRGDLRFYNLRLPLADVGQAVGKKIKSYSGSGSPLATLRRSRLVRGLRAPAVVTQSGRGPAPAGTASLLKPDVLAPGHQIASSIPNPSGNPRANIGFKSGTSMASPHVAGVAAIVRQRHRRWTPMEIRSAIVTSARHSDNRRRRIRTQGGRRSGPFDYGAGLISPSRALRPGLVYQSGPGDWLAYLCGIGQIRRSDSRCDGRRSTLPRNLNSPSISVSELHAKTSVRRRVKSVGPRGRRRTYHAKVIAPHGTVVRVRPRVLRLRGGRRQRFRVTIFQAGAPANRWTGGYLIWRSRHQRVVSPIVVRPAG